MGNRQYDREGDHLGYREDSGYGDDSGYDDDSGYGDDTGYDEDAGYEEDFGYREDPGYEKNLGYGEDSGYGDNFGYDEDAGYEEDFGYGKDSGSGRKSGYDGTGDPGYDEVLSREDHREYERRRRFRRARREEELRRKKRRAALILGILFAAAAVLAVTGLPGRILSRGGSAGDAGADEETEETAERLTQAGDVAETDAGSTDGQSGQESHVLTDVAADTAEEDTAEKLYAYYESDSTLVLGESLTDISIYDAQRHISSGISEEGTDTGDTVYGESADEDGSGSDENAASASDADYIDSQYVILVDADSGEILLERRAFEQIVPASMTKVMTLLVAVEAMEDYESQLQDTFTITQEICDEAYLSGSSFVGYGVDDVATVEDLLYGTILPSGADAAMALAEYTAGSQEAFVALMNEKVSALGLSSTTHFSNVIGLYDDGDNYSTPYDMCVIMNAAIDNEYCREILSARTWTTQPIMDNPDGTTISNWFLRRAEDHIGDWEILCGKTGFVNESGNCAVSYLQNAAGGNYIACTALTYNSWRCIYDHAAIYNCYLP